MAISTAANIITEVQATYRAIDSTTVQSYLSIVMDDLCKDLPIVVDKCTLKLTADTQEYALATGAPWYAWRTTTATQASNTCASLVRIESAHYISSSTSRTPLIPTTVQKLDQTTETQNWRYDDSGTPIYIFTTPNSTGGFSVGLYPAPDTTSSASGGVYYPSVDFVYRNKIGSSFTGTATIPSSITNPDVLVQGVLWHIYKRENNGDDGPYYPLYIKAKSNLADELARRHREYRVNAVNQIQAPRGV